MAGCSDDGVNSDGAADETGGTEPGLDPQDPADGEGSVPPNNGSVDAVWVSPSSLGNGLVHDTRVDVDTTSYTSSFTNIEFEKGVTWSTFVQSNSSIAKLGYRPAQVNATVDLSGQELEVIDRSVYIKDDDANYRTEIFTHLFSTRASERAYEGWEPAALGARPTSIKTFAAGGRLGYSVAWVYDSPTQTPKVPWIMKSGQSKAEIEALIADPNFRAVSLSSRKREDPSGYEYAAILVQTESADDESAVSWDIPTPDLGDAISARWDLGYYPVRISTAEPLPTDGVQYVEFVNVLWARRPAGISVQTRINLTDSTFEEEDSYWRSHGYHLETSDTYMIGAKPRRAAVWVRYAPYLRWQGTEFAPGDPTYAAKYKMFHDQAIARMSYLTDVDCSGGQPCPDGTECFQCSGDVPCFNDGVCIYSPEFGGSARPSATLHIFEGSSVVLNRAYTYAPSIYPTTEINAPMEMGSVAKSITAAAVLLELWRHGLNAREGFADLIGVADSYMLLDANGSPVRVTDVLNHVGGFASNMTAVLSYSDHALVAEAGFSLPIDGKDLFEYVFDSSGDHIDPPFMSDDVYWTSGWTGVPLSYSNVGYTMLGELVRVVSGVAYGEYVKSEFLVPLGLDERVVPAPALRVLTPGPTRTRSGSYLIDTDHQYNVGGLAPSAPGFGLNDSPDPKWHAYVGPQDTRAPAWAGLSYSGGVLPGWGPTRGGWLGS
jgi:CubicO group peptidase (beta-lactamase class C family)